MKESDNGPRRRGTDTAGFPHVRVIPFGVSTANLPTNIVDFGGFDSSIISIIMGGILMSTGDFSESLSQAILVGVMLVDGLGVFILSDTLPDVII